MLFQSIVRIVSQTHSSAHRRLLQEGAVFPSNTQNEETKPPILAGPRTPVPVLSPSSSPTPAPSPSTSPSASLTPHPPLIPKKSPPTVSSLPHRPSAPGPSSSQRPTISARRHKSSRNLVPILAGCIGGGVFLSILIGLYICRGGKVATVKPWATGLSGQLQKAFVTGKSHSSNYQLYVLENVSQSICLFLSRKQIHQR